MIGAASFAGFKFPGKTYILSVGIPFFGGSVFKLVDAYMSSFLFLVLIKFFLYTFQA
jgi:hypothetical protein